MPRIIIQEPGKPPQPYRFELATSSVLLGRAADSTIVLECGSISGRHAEMARTTGGYELIDLGSTNGLQKDGQLVDRWSLKSGDRLMLGDVEFTFELSEEEIGTLAMEATHPLGTPESVESPPLQADGETTVENIPHLGDLEDPSPPAEEDEEDEPKVKLEIAAFLAKIPSWVRKCAVLLILAIALFLGASKRHEVETGTSLGAVIKKRLTTPDINRIRKITGEDPDEVFRSRMQQAQTETVNAVQEELTPEMEEWENRERTQSTDDGGYASVIQDGADADPQEEPTETDEGDEEEEPIRFADDASSEP